MVDADLAAGFERTAFLAQFPGRVSVSIPTSQCYSSRARRTLAGDNRQPCASESRRCKIPACTPLLPFPSMSLGSRSHASELGVRTTVGASTSSPASLGGCVALSRVFRLRGGADALPVEELEGKGRGRSVCPPIATLSSEHSTPSVYSYNYSYNCWYNC